VIDYTIKFVYAESQRLTLMLIDLFWFVGGIFVGAGCGYVWGANVKAGILLELHSLRTFFDQKQVELRQAGAAAKKVL
jgi:hypothetical protein